MLSMHRFYISVLLFSCSYVMAQGTKGLFQTKKIQTDNSIVLDSVSINPSYFKVLDANGKVLDSTLYSIDFKKAVLRFEDASICL